MVKAHIFISDSTMNAVELYVNHLYKGLQAKYITLWAFSIKVYHMYSIAFVVRQDCHLSDQLFFYLKLTTCQHVYYVCRVQNQPNAISDLLTGNNEANWQGAPKRASIHG